MSINSFLRCGRSITANDVGVLGEEWEFMALRSMIVQKLN